MYSHKRNNQEQSNYKHMAEQAIQLAIKGEWDEAVKINRELAILNPMDTNTYNRLGKASEETGDYEKAKQAFQKALTLSPYNNIAARNLSRLNQFSSSQYPAKRSRKLSPSAFIEEQGKTITTLLHEVRSKGTYYQLVLGDLLELNIKANTLLISDPSREITGTLEQPIASQLLKLISKGNKYRASVTSIDDEGIHITIQETYQHLSQINVTSFPTHKSTTREKAPLPIETDLDDLEEQLEDRDPLEIQLGDDEYVEPEINRTQNTESIEPEDSTDEDHFTK
jgi:hypothetical protein